MWQLFTASSAYKKTARSAAILWTLFILLLCLLPAKDIPEVHVPLADKWTHFIFFGVFSFLWLCARPVRKTAWLLGMFLISTGFGALIELLQGLFTSLGRSADAWDILADGIGSLLGVSLFYLLSGIAARKA